MRTVDVTWSRIADGVQEVQRLEVELWNRWSPAIAQAVRRRYERRTSMACAAVAALAFASAGRLATSGSAFFAVVATIVGGVFAAALAVRWMPWGRLGATEQIRLVIPKLARLAVRIMPPKAPLSLGILEAWWAAVGQVTRARSRYDPAAQAAGEEGESLLVAELSLRLPYDHVALRGVLVRGKLDADVVIVGSTGIWVFEVKHWNGTITCADGRWERTKTYWGEGGKYVTEVTPFKWPPDEQWRVERAAVEETIRRRVKEPGDVGALIGGGIAFTHPAARLTIDGTSTAAWGDLAWWSSAATGATSVGVEAAKTFEIVDALLAWHRRLADEEAGQPRCGVELARRLALEATARAQTYCGGRSE